MDRPAGTTVLLGVLWAASFAAFAVYVAHVTIGLPPTGAEVDWRLLSPLAYMLTAAICFTRVATVPRERLIWSMFGGGMVTSSAGWAYYYLVLQHDASPPYPSPADVLWLSFYVAGFIALMLMLRARLERFSKNLWLDAATGALAFAAVSAALLVGPIVASSGGSTEAVATSLAYPLADILTLTLVLGMFALTGWRPERRWVLIGLAWTIQVVVDTTYLYKVSHGTYVAGGIVDAGWALSYLLVAWSAWQPSDRPALRFEGWQVVGVPLAFAIVAISVLMYGNFAPLNPAASVLAILALLVSLLGVASSYLEQRRLEALAKRDALTGLYNYREFHRRLDDMLAAAQTGDLEFAVVLMDIDGFKDINDLRGHLEGDRVLREVSAAIVGCKRSSDIAARIGGDEFALLVPGSDGQAAAVAAQRVKERVESLGENIGLSFGVAEWPTDGPSKEVLLLRADVAMYSAKSGGEVEVAVSGGRTEMRRGDRNAAAAGGRGRPPALVPAPDRDLEKAQLRAYAEALRVTYAQGLERAQQLKQNYLATVLTLASAVEAKDEYTGGHINRVHRLGLLLARELVPEEADDPQMAYGFLLHDIGKLAVPDEILNKSGPLTDEQWVLMRGHPEAGVRILAPIPFLGRAIDVVRHHHERWDGCGYPTGLAGEEIPMWSRIFAVVDSVDAMTSDRPYRAALSLEVAHEELEKGAGTQFDPVCVAAFMRLDRGQVESLIQTSSTARTLRAAEPATALATANRPPVAAD